MRPSAVNTLGCSGLVLCVLVAVFACLVGPVQAQDGAPSPRVNRTMCMFLRAGNSPLTSAMHVKFVVENLAPTRFPSSSWAFYPLGQDAGTVADIAAAYANRGDRCDAVLGPGSSSSSVAVAALMDLNVPWVDYSSTAVTLNDRTLYPTFSRVVPNDAFMGGAAARFMASMGWKVINMLLTDEAYGLSYSNELAAAHKANGGTVALRRSVAIAASFEEVASALQWIALNSPSRIVAVTVTNTDWMLAAIRASRATELGLILVFSESACSNAANGWGSIPGALCMTYTTNVTATQELRDAYVRRNVESDVAALVPAGATRASVLAVANTTGTFSYLASDAAMHVMNAIEVAGYGSPEVVRAVPSVGLSGPIVLDASGNRATATMQLRCATGLGDDYAVGEVGMTNSFTYLDATVGFMWLGGNMTRLIPTDLWHPTTASPGVGLWVIGAAVGSVAVAVIIIWAAWRFLRHSAGRARDGVHITFTVVRLLADAAALILKAALTARMFRSSDASSKWFAMSVMLGIGGAVCLVELLARLHRSFLSENPAAAPRQESLLHLAVIVLLEAPFVAIVTTGVHAGDIAYDAVAVNCMLSSAASIGVRWATMSLGQPPLSPPAPAPNSPFTSGLAAANAGRSIATPALKPTASRRQRGGGGPEQRTATLQRAAAATADALYIHRSPLTPHEVAALLHEVRRRMGGVAVEGSSSAAAGTLIAAIIAAEASAADSNSPNASQGIPPLHTPLPFGMSTSSRGASGSPGFLAPGWVNDSAGVPPRHSNSTGPRGGSRASVAPDGDGWGQLGRVGVGAGVFGMSVDENFTRHLPAAAIHPTAQLLSHRRL